MEQSKYVQHLAGHASIQLEPSHSLPTSHEAFNT